MAKDRLEYYLSLPYSVRLTKRTEGDNVYYLAEIPELPGCMSDGKTSHLALQMVEDAKRVWLESALREGIDIPEPRDYSDFSGRFVVRLPRALHRNLALQASEQGASLNQHIVHLLSESSAVQASISELRSAFAQAVAGLRIALSQEIARLNLRFRALEIQQRGSLSVSQPRPGMEVYQNAQFATRANVDLNTTIGPYFDVGGWTNQVVNFGGGLSIPHSVVSARREAS